MRYELTDHEWTGMNALARAQCRRCFQLAGNELR
jgi:hypothetical protein